MCSAFSLSFHIIYNFVIDPKKRYVSMRKLGGGKKTITATPRQLESLVRISEAHARMRYSSVVERMDVAEAIRLVRVAIQQAAIDPRTGIPLTFLTASHLARTNKYGCGLTC